ncbi:cupin domain-containing protein [Jiella avicenniae]|uniref:Cupin domain-containing protein n=1 Tax=Jiella avicenniae TaxID=2907202 RepID=A0A9X1P1B9_9HYPH|nr:cupin domain-containing protein [Jiella avicenniae]MCE7029580.1 cupin domain-containing protein [Jiella avicenniae]
MMFKQAGIAVALALASTGALAQSQEVIKNGSRDGTIGSSDNFTGTAYVEPVFDNRDPFAVNAGKVTFLPGARSNWHTHPAGQMLVVTEGTGWVQEEGQPKEIIQPGDVVWCPPDVRHWHGATDTTAVTHYAIQQFKDGENVVWGDPVTDEQYAGPAE